MNHKDISQALIRVKTENPLVHNITNVVVTNFTANGLLALGASPVMAYAKEEVAEMASIAGALVLNIGTLTKEEVEAMLIAGKSANEAGVPIIFDPVGAGATSYRTETSRHIVKELDIAILRGNAAEIANVIGVEWAIKGVDAGAGNGDVVELAQTAAKKLDTVVVITGKSDVVSDGSNTYIIHNGHSILTKVTGTGCLLSSVIGSFAAIEKNLILASVSALVSYGVAAELAEKTTGAHSPGSFQIEFLNQLNQLSPEQVEQQASFEKR